MFTRLSLIHLLGDITILPGLVLSQAPHQLNELFAIILCLQEDIKYISQKEFVPVL